MGWQLLLPSRSGLHQRQRGRVRPHGALEPADAKGEEGLGGEGEKV